MRKVFSLLLALCLLHGTIAVAEESRDVSHLHIGDFTFELPQGFEIDFVQETSNGICEAFCLSSAEELLCYTIDYNAIGMSGDDFYLTPELTNAIMGLGFIGVDDVDQAIALLDYFDPIINRDALPNGGMLTIYQISEGNNMFSHYYQGQNQGFIMFMGSDPKNAEAALETALSIIGSFELDGVSPEQMTTDAAAAFKPGASQPKEDANQQQVTITGDSAKVRTEASTTAKLIRTVYKGDSFPLQGEKGDFYIIQIDGKTGYVHKGVSAVK